VTRREDSSGGSAAELAPRIDELLGAHVLEPHEPAARESGDEHLADADGRGSALHSREGDADRFREDEVRGVGGPMDPAEELLEEGHRPRVVLVVEVLQGNDEGGVHEDAHRDFAFP